MAGAAIIQVLMQVSRHILQDFDLCFDQIKVPELNANCGGVSDNT